MDFTVIVSVGSFSTLPWPCSSFFGSVSGVLRCSPRGARSAGLRWSLPAPGAGRDDRTRAATTPGRAMFAARGCRDVGAPEKRESGVKQDLEGEELLS